MFVDVTLASPRILAVCLLGDFEPFGTVNVFDRIGDITADFGSVHIGLNQRLSLLAEHDGSSDCYGSQVPSMPQLFSNAIKFFALVNYLFCTRRPVHQVLLITVVLAHPRSCLHFADSLELP